MAERKYDRGAHRAWVAAVLERSIADRAACLARAKAADADAHAFDLALKAEHAAGDAGLSGGRESLHGLIEARRESARRERRQAKKMRETIAEWRAKLREFDDEDAFMERLASLTGVLEPTARRQMKTRRIATGEDES